MSDHSPVTAAVAARRVDVRRLIVLAVALLLAVTAVTALTRPDTAVAAARPRITSATTSNYAKAMLALLNQERRAHKLRPLSMDRRLQLSAHRHNLRMAKADQMSHQLPHEAVFTTRISNAGYHWLAAGENIGWNSALTKSGVLRLEREMYSEVPPDNGHRLNILSTSFRQVGIDVCYDARHHKIWFTQDFGRPR